LHCCPPVVREVLFDTDHELRSSFGEAARSVVLILWVRQESVAGHEYARPNTGASITPGNSGNGALPTHESEEGENNDNEANNRAKVAAVIRAFDEAAMCSRRTSSRARSKRWNCELQSRRKLARSRSQPIHPMNK